MKKILFISIILTIFYSCEPDSSIQVYGCTDSEAANYHPNATMNDGSCTYLTIGDYHQGGIIFYLDGNGGGLIAAPSDQSTCTEWGCSGTLVGSDVDSIGIGSQNTDSILAGCSNLGIAAYICDTLTLEGYNDWFLSSKDELDEMFLNLCVYTVNKNT